MFHRNLQENDLHAPSNVRVKNSTLGTLPRLTVVKFVGYDTATNYPIVEPITSDLDCVRGILKEDIVAGGAGFMAGYATFSGVDTSSYSLEQKLYGSATGQLTTTPTKVFVAQVIGVGVQGALYVKPEVVESSGMLATEEFTLSLTGGVPQSVNLLELQNVKGVEVFSDSGDRITGGLFIEGTSSGSTVSVTVSSNININDLRVVVSGDK